MKIENEIFVLQMQAKVYAMKEIIYPVLLKEKDSLILVDTAFPGQLEILKSKINEEGLNPDNIKDIILTHHDIDHIGNASVLHKENPQINILAHEEEEGYLDGENKPLKIKALELNLENMPDKIKNLYMKMKCAFENCRVVPDKLLKHGDILPFLEGIEVIHTPGHTKGHISLYIKKYKVLIAGDALTVRDGKLRTGDDNMHYDSVQNKESVKKFLNYDIQKVICYHGGLFQGDFKEGLLKLI